MQTNCRIERIPEAREGLKSVIIRSQCCKNILGNFCAPICLTGSLHRPESQLGIVNENLWPEEHTLRRNNLNFNSLWKPFCGLKGFFCLSFYKEGHICCVHQKPLEKLVSVRTQSSQQIYRLLRQVHRLLRAGACAKPECANMLYDKGAKGNLSPQSNLDKWSQLMFMGQCFWHRLPGKTGNAPFTSAQKSRKNANADCVTILKTYDVLSGD